MSAATPAIPESLPIHFHVTEKVDRWILKCRVCSARWELTHKGAAHPGNTLHLLNHAASHTKVRPS